MKKELSGRYGKAYSVLTENTLTACVLMVGFLYAYRPLGPDEFYFLHRAWSDLNLHQSYLSAYPFPFFPWFASWLVGVFDLEGAILIKFFILLIYVITFYGMVKKQSWLYGLALMCIFVMMFTNRALDFRPEIIANVCILVGCFLLTRITWNCCGDRGVNVSVGIFILSALAMMSSPRYFVLASLLLACPLFFIRERLYSLLWRVGIVYILFAGFYVLVIGGLDGLVSALLNKDMRPESDLDYRMGRLLGPRYLLVTVALIIAAGIIINSHRNRGFKLISVAFVGSFSVCFVFLLVLDKRPYEYSSLPLLGVLVVFLTFLRLPVVGDNNLHSAAWRRLCAIVGILLPFLLLYYAKDLRILFRQQQEYESTRANLEAMSSDLKLLNSASASPFDQLSYLPKFCDRYKGARVYVNNYRWHPVCMPDDYSADVWNMRRTKDSVINAIINNKVVVFKAEDHNKIVIIYK